MLDRRVQIGARTIMSKATLAIILMLVALLASVWSLLLGIIAPFGAVGSCAFVVVAMGGVASLAAGVLSARQPRQIVILGIACLLIAGHVFLWCWVGLIALRGGI